MSNQARWSVLQSYNLLKWHRAAHRAAIKVLEIGASLRGLRKLCIARNDPQKFRIIDKSILCIQPTYRANISSLLTRLLQLPTGFTGLHIVFRCPSVGPCIG
ncbi:hypothetical protein Ahy_B02g058080 isoform B [Arachis hypogaea]|uniref:Uncharacterized protein n=1 Tax=Arachis hypogaea TaxID=3818 RepID=A0A445ADT8_ARAHY|nr:hypothetical protein Ahy_B02g058080 isoform B [Arachis hypogaea]